MSDKLKAIKILMVDNYDSFTFNLVHYLEQIDFPQCNVEIIVKRNDQINLNDIKHIAPTHIVISPGPCDPDKAGLSLEIVKKYHQTLPILGVCLGHQVIGQFFGAKVIKAEKVVHGKISKIYHNNLGVFRGINQGFNATRYHSLILEKETLPSCLQITAWTSKENSKFEDSVETIMAIKHRDFPIEGIQFHPESVLSESGLTLLTQFFI